jgi:hypothetical protein
MSIKRNVYLNKKRLTPEPMPADEWRTCGACENRSVNETWSEIISPPSHLCICLSRLDFDASTFRLVKKKTKIELEQQLQCAGFIYDLYFIIVSPI